jgi:thiol:disulfide interchange protein DsbC
VAAGRSLRSEPARRGSRARVWLVGLAAAWLFGAPPIRADEAAIRRNLPARLPELPPIDEVRPSPVPGLWEVRLGHEVVYSDADGAFLLEGDLIDTRRQLNLTEHREADLKRIDVARLPLADAVVWKRGSGARRLVVFADPNCSYCRRLERELSDVPDIAVYTFVIPILGEDSVRLSRAIWCAKDRGVAWRRWMLEGVSPPDTASCDTRALTRNLALQARHGVAGTPSLVFDDGERVAGVLAAAELDRKLASLKVRPRG